MNQSAIFGPFLTMMLLTLIVWFQLLPIRAHKKCQGDADRQAHRHHPNDAGRCAAADE